MTGERGYGGAAPSARNLRRLAVRAARDASVQVKCAQAARLRVPWPA